MCFDAGDYFLSIGIDQNSNWGALEKESESSIRMQRDLESDASDFEDYKQRYFMT